MISPTTSLQSVQERIADVVETAEDTSSPEHRALLADLLALAFAATRRDAAL
jgi:hypothetical protein